MFSDRIISGRTWTIVAWGVVVSAVCMALIRTGAGGSETGEAVVANLPSLLTAASGSAAALWAAVRFKRNPGLFRQWLLIGLGVLALFTGDAVYAYLEVIARQEVPFPSIADVFYVASFPLLGAGLVLALLSFRRSLKLGRPLILAAIVVALATAALWASVFSPVLTDSESDAFTKLLGLFYPIGDFWLLLFPALALALALSRLGGGRLAWPWWGVVLGLALISVSDTLFALMESAGTYSSGSPIDLGWWLGYVAIAVGASLAVDVQKPGKGGRRS